MDNPLSQTPNNGKNPADAHNLSLYFGSLNLDSDGINSDTIKNQYNVAQETSDGTPWLSENSVSDRRSIWDYQFFYTEGGDSASNPQYKNCFSDLFEEENFDGGSSNQQPRMESFRSYPSMSNYPSNPVYYGDSSFRPTALYNYGGDQFAQQANNALCYGNNYKREIDAFAEAKSGFDHGFLMEILQGGDYEQIESVALICKGSYLKMMVDKDFSIVFQKLVDCITNLHLNLIAKEVLSWNHVFLYAAFCKQGSSSIIKLMKRLKNSSHAFTMTKCLSTRFLEIMTDYAAREVIQHCFIYFGDEPNKILYDKVMHHFRKLATHKVGCRALNESISIIGGEQRSNLLNLVAEHSAYLSNDPYGNYVVQNVLSLKQQDVSTRIVLSLRGEFVELAKTTGGSNVVEKCMDSSDFGLVTVVEEILDNPKSPIVLATDYFGNYVIQTALRKTKEYGLSDLYGSLVKCLLPYREVLNRTPGGKNVMNLIKDDGRPEGRTSMCGKGSGMRWMMLGGKNSMV